MLKILKPYTIIPAHLYVSRDADRQIENIIQDMGRPGYVLVSRQMGKTNLLLNVKRKLESADDTFVYLDLSNPYDTARACFENIIDLALETNLDKFESVAKDIIERRKSLFETPAHKQHTNELRLLLKNMSGKLVVILDEIDALTKTPYSDQIFAQIRSIYFSRVNFPEFERLTYILSGVVEPSEIIKDPKISPFNIGQKIFLNDFSEKEFLDLLKQSNLLLTSEIQERIFYWTSGNPRITWDICSEVESHLHAYNQISIAELDKLVQDFYLTSYDKPPVDNIRELVMQNREIRNAIVEINYGNGDKITDKIKNKLYLAGIVNYNKDRVEIKNEIIKQSLNLDWIRSLEEEDKGYLRLGFECFSVEDYSNSLRYFLKYLEDNEFPVDSNKSLYNYMIGFSYYKASNFIEAEKFLQLTDFDIEDEPKYFFNTKFIVALCYTYLEDFDSALLHYKEVLDSKRRDEIYLNSLVNYGSVSLKSGIPHLLDNAINIFSDIINDLGPNSPKIKEDKAKEAKSIALYNSGIIYTNKGDVEKAKECFVQAVGLSNIASKPLMTLGLINVFDNKEDKFPFLSELVEEINLDKLIPSEFDPENPLQFTINELKQIAIICFIDYKEELFGSIRFKLTEYFKEHLALMIFNFAAEAVNTHDWESSRGLYQGLADEINNPEYDLKGLLYETIKFASYFNSNEHNYHLFSDVAGDIKSVDSVDISNFANLILILTNSEEYDEGLRIARFVKGLQNSSDNNLNLDFLVIDHLELNLYRGLADRSSSLTKARYILELLRNPQLTTSRSNLIGETGLDLIKSNAENTLQLNNQRSPVRIINKYGRNELVKARYQDGTMITIKFKKIEEDLKNGKCTIVEPTIV